MAIRYITSVHVQNGKVTICLDNGDTLGGISTVDLSAAALSIPKMMMSAEVVLVENRKRGFGDISE